MYQHVNAAPTPLRQLRPDVPESLEEPLLHLAGTRSHIQTQDNLLLIHDALADLFVTGIARHAAGVTTAP
ncbi:hypothetical protein SAMN05428954_1540 [Streptomyces sp. 2112.3]|nr:hypothetical protein SAMN05428954_1540 [Streptomyces sp. 2112.3]